MPDATQAAPAKADKRRLPTPARLAAIQAQRLPRLTATMTAAEQQAWFDSLPQRHQTMLMLREAGKSWAEIGEAMHLAGDSVRDAVTRVDPERLWVSSPQARKTAAIARWQSLELRATEAITDDKLAESSASQLVMMAAIARDKQAQAEAILSPEIAAQVESVEVTLRRKWTTTGGGSTLTPPVNNSVTNHAKSCDDAQVIEVEDVSDE